MCFYLSLFVDSVEQTVNPVDLNPVVLVGCKRSMKTLTEASNYSKSEILEVFKSVHERFAVPMSTR